MFLRFLDDEKMYKITNGINNIAYDKLCIYQSDIPINTSGFEIICDNGEIISYMDFTEIYSISKKIDKDDINDDYIIFTSDTRIHSVYYVYDDDGYVVNYLSSVTNPIEPNVILVRSGIGSCYEIVQIEEFMDEDNIPLYKVVNGRIVNVDEDDKIFIKNKMLKKEKQEKIEELSRICSKCIEDGISYNGLKFSYKLEDQNNLNKLLSLAVTTGLSVPYHADGASCELYRSDDLFLIYRAQSLNLVCNEAYFNQLKMYILNEIDNIEDIYCIHYGQDLTGEYLETYNQIVEQQKMILNAYTNTMSL